MEISQTSAEISQKKGFNAMVYDGYKLPFDNNSVDVVGSINVLEHTDDTESFLNEIFRVLKPDGIFVLVCPNFLSITNSYHAHTAGFPQKIKNLCQIISKFLTTCYEFERMATTEREDFHADDDACVVTNPIDIKKWAKSHNMSELYWSSKTTYGSGIAEKLDVSFLRYFFGSSAFVFKKSK